MKHLTLVWTKNKSKALIKKFRSFPKTCPRFSLNHVHTLKKLLLKQLETLKPVRVEKWAKQRESENRFLSSNALSPSSAQFARYGPKSVPKNLPRRLCSEWPSSLWRKNKQRSKSAKRLKLSVTQRPHLRHQSIRSLSEWAQGLHQFKNVSNTYRKPWKLRKRLWKLKLRKHVLIHLKEQRSLPR
jgi:hypothetical protein